MHHKYVVVDGRWVWTGSMNLTGNDTVRNDNNFLMIDSRDLAANYQQEFEEMWQDRFGADSLRDTPNPEVIVNGVTITSAFAPDDGVAGRLIDALRSARTSIEFLAFSFTSDPIADAMLERAGEGVAVRGVMEASQAAGSGSELERLRAAGLDVRRDGNPGNMHHKVILIDRSIVVTGSYNFSQSAETRNDENVLILRDPALAEAFEAEFERVFAMAVP
jgi:phosphatidylserine/phosphatidylglycerophosphate/cardiolipin synthase-like enzyme